MGQGAPCWPQEGSALSSLGKGPAHCDASGRAAAQVPHRVTRGTARPQPLPSPTASTHTAVPLTATRSAYRYSRAHTPPRPARPTWQARPVRSPAAGAGRSGATQTRPVWFSQGFGHEGRSLPPRGRGVPGPGSSPSPQRALTALKASSRGSARTPSLGRSPRPSPPSRVDSRQDPDSTGIA